MNILGYKIVLVEIVILNTKVDDHIKQNQKGNNRRAKGELMSYYLKALRKEFTKGF